MVIRFTNIININSVSDHSFNLVINTKRTVPIGNKEKRFHVSFLEGYQVRFSLVFYAIL